MGGGCYNHDSDTG